MPLDILEKFIAILTINAGVIAIVNPKNIFVGDVDVVVEKQKDLPYPVIVLSTVSVASRTVPQNAFDAMFQIDVMSRNSQLECEKMFSAVVTALNYDSGNKNTSHVFWQRLGSGADLNETDRRLWRKALTFQVWSISGQ